MRGMSRGCVALAGALAVTGCSAGAGPFGIGALVGKRTLASAEPLFGFESLKCFEQPGFLLRVYGSRESGAPDWKTDPCKALIHDIQTAAQIDAAAPAQKAGTSTQNTADQPPTGNLTVSEVRRNEVMDAMLAESNRKCADYTTLLKSYDGGMNGSLSILSILTGGLGSFVGGANTAKALA